MDSTPLFVLLAARTTSDRGRAFAEAMWPHRRAALSWIDKYGDRDGDGSSSTSAHPEGLAQQGWKDSHDSVFHADGTLAQGADCPVRGAGLRLRGQRGAAKLAVALDHIDAADELARQAAALRRRFEEAFWCEDLGTYALALDGEKRPCRVRTSNPGHCLFTGIAATDRAARVAQTLLHPESFSGWGVRTVAEGEARYNPMSYHNGSIWPHDNAIVGAGLARYGWKDGAAKILGGMFDASLFVELNRMPELFCGFRRRPGEGPTRYPVACSPQAWSAGSVYQLLQACLGLRVEAGTNRVCLDYPLLPEFLEEVRVRGIRVGTGSVDLLFRRHGDDVGVNVLARSGGVQVVVVK